MCQFCESTIIIKTVWFPNNPMKCSGDVAQTFRQFIEQMLGVVHGAIACSCWGLATVLGTTGGRTGAQETCVELAFPPRCAHLASRRFGRHRIFQNSGMRALDYGRSRWRRYNWRFHGHTSSPASLTGAIRCHRRRRFRSYHLKRGRPKASDLAAHEHHLPPHDKRVDDAVSCAAFSRCSPPRHPHPSSPATPIADPLPLLPATLIRWARARQSCSPPHRPLLLSPAAGAANPPHVVLHSVKRKLMEEECVMVGYPNSGLNIRDLARPACSRTHGVVR
ncbi:hypothetical protein SEVIR_8G063833v4 [Setaria viridis]